MNAMIATAAPIDETNARQLTSANEFKRAMAIAIEPIADDVATQFLIDLAARFNENTDR